MIPRAYRSIILTNFCLVLVSALLPICLTLWKDQNWNDQLDDWWHYTGVIGGPDHWGKKAYMSYSLWQICHRGRHQSPINVSTSHLVLDSNLGSLRLDGADRPMKLTVKNTGHDIMVTFHTDAIILSEGPLSYTFILFGALIKFGANSDRGSDHSIDGRHFPGELQLYGYNSDLFSNYTMALSSPHGIVVLSMFMQVGLMSSKDLQVIVAAAKRTTLKGAETAVNGFNLKNLLPLTSEYITYEGSLPFPGCHESVTWLILNQPIVITENELDVLRKLRISSVMTSAFMADNFRPTQPVNQRTIRTNIRLRHRQKQEMSSCGLARLQYFYSNFPNS